MKVRRKGFTLVELLVVIGILSIITLVCVPIILSTMEKAKINAEKESIYGIINAAELYYADKKLEDNNFPEKNQTMAN